MAPLFLFGYVLKSSSRRSVLERVPDGGQPGATRALCAEPPRVPTGRNSLKAAVGREWSWEDELAYDCLMGVQTTRAKNARVLSWRLAATVLSFNRGSLVFLFCIISGLFFCPF